ncbi:MAG: DNA mismatch repair endonuclease MutL [Phycisphaerales bacterium]|nr:DNA mismatch repair endonuclease MutL [Phycisphaerales bacterium]
MGRIRVLPPGLVNRIAAGECVERPASVLKELVENALDAGARRIDVQILDGGRELIHIADDGIGMDPDDLRLAVTPHATSKIAADDDLFNIRTLGFRGEALPSIGSVSRLTITSRTRESDVAHRIVVDAGEVRAAAPCAAPIGTTVEVRDLFYCVPARRKFLKTNQTESGHTSEQLARIALAQPRVAFTLVNQKRSVHDLSVTDDTRKRIADLFGPELARPLIAIRREGDDVLIEGLVAPPAESRGSTKWEYVFVNGRFIRDRFVSHAIKEAYRSLIDPSRYPVAFLFISINPAHVDVNVHPTKVEVRWRDSNYIHGQVLAALRERFQSMNLDHSLRARPDQEAHREGVRQAMVDFFTGAARGSPQSSGAGPAISAIRPAARQSEAGSASQFAFQARRPDAPFTAARQLPTVGLDRDAIESQRDSVGGATVAREPSPAQEHCGESPAHEIEGAAPSGQREIPRGASPRPFEFRPPRAIQLHDTYLVVETDTGMLVIDQHALHERILYEEFQRRVTDRSLESQRMLIPDIVSAPPDRLEALESHADTLARLGIELTQAGPNTVALHAFPSFLERVDRSEFVRDLLDLLAEPGARPAADTLLHKILDMMACKAAVKAGDPLTLDEIHALLQRRELAERSSHCPHGRPTTLQFSLAELERQFKRR